MLANTPERRLRARHLALFDELTMPRVIPHLPGRGVDAEHAYLPAAPHHIEVVVPVEDVHVASRRAGKVPRQELIGVPAGLGLRDLGGRNRGRSPRAPPRRPSSRPRPSCRGPSSLHARTPPSTPAPLLPPRSPAQVSGIPRWDGAPMLLLTIVSRAAAPISAGGRLLDTWSLCDVFFAHSCKKLGMRQETATKVVERLRPEYPRLLGQRPERLRVHFAPRGDRHATCMWPELVFDTRLLRSCLATAAAAKDELARVQRGRPKEDWRTMFSKAIDALSKEMQAKRISDEQIDAAIESVRARRRQARIHEAVVTIPAP